MTILADEAQEVQIMPMQPQLDLDDVLTEALVIAQENIVKARELVDLFEQQLKNARDGYTHAKKQLQNAYLANGLNSDGTERKPRTKRTPPS